MANKNNVYLQVEFKSGNLFQYSKDPEDGFEKHINSKNTISYRKYWKQGAYGVYRGTTVRETKFGKEVSIHLINVEGKNVFISLPLFDEKKNIAAYAESFIATLPYLEANFVYRIFPYAMEKDGTDYKNYGVSVRHADMHAETVREDFPIDRLSFAYETKAGEVVEGDVPKVEWVQDFDGSMKKDCSARNKYLFDVLMKYADERTTGASNKVTGGEPPKPYTGEFKNNTTVTDQPEAQHEEPEQAEEEIAEEEAPKAQAPPKKVETPLATVSTVGGEEKPSAKKEKPDLPF